MTEPQGDKLRTTARKPLRRVPAGFGWRLLASIIDAAILALPIYRLWKFAWPDNVIVSFRGAYYRVEAPSLQAYLLMAILCWLYYSLWESSRWQATAGKQAVAIIVTDLEGSRVSFGAASLRAWPFLSVWFRCGVGSGL